MPIAGKVRARSGGVLRELDAEAATSPPKIKVVTRAREIAYRPPAASLEERGGVSDLWALAEDACSESTLATIPIESISVKGWRAAWTDSPRARSFAVRSALGHRPRAVKVRSRRVLSAFSLLKQCVHIDCVR